MLPAMTLQLKIHDADSAPWDGPDAKPECLAFELWADFRSE